MSKVIFFAEIFTRPASLSESLSMEAAVIFTSPSSDLIRFALISPPSSLINTLDFPSTLKLPVVEINKS